MARRFLRSLFLVLAIVFAMHVPVGIWLWGNQEQMIYFPRPYTAGTDARGDVEPLAYDTDGARHTAFLLNAGDRHPDRLWVAFNGNASLALDWVWILKDAIPKHEAAILVDYPGYGENPGRPSPASIAAASDAALAAALARWPGARPEIAALGYSLGAAAALEFASRHPVSRAVLLAPFTSMREIAERQVGPILWVVLRHRFDNRARLADLAKRTPRPAVTILYGSGDTLIPPRMCLALAEPHKGWIAAKEVPSAKHDDLAEVGREDLLRALGWSP